MDLFTRNQTQEINTAQTGTLPHHPVSTYISNIILTLMCIIIVCCDVIAILVMRRCKRVPYQCLNLSISYLSSEIVGLLLFVIHELLIFGFDFNTDILFNSRITTVAIMHCISSASMAAIILERVFALKANLKYTLALKRIKIHLIIAVIWLTHIIVTVFVVSISFHYQCNWTIANCDFAEVNKIAKYCFLILTIFYDVIMVFANTIVYKIARQHAIQIDAMKQTTTTKGTSNYPDTVSERQYASIVVFVKIVTLYVLFQVPMVFAMLIGTNIPEIRHRTPMRMLRSIAYFLFLLNSFLNLYFYIIKIKECRMVWFFMLGKVFKKFKQKANVIRLEVFDIVVYSQQEETIAMNESSL